MRVAELAQTPVVGTPGFTAPLLELLLVPLDEPLLLEDPLPLPLEDPLLDELLLEDDDPPEELLDDELPPLDELPLDGGLLEDDAPDAPASVVSPRGGNVTEADPEHAAPNGRIVPSSAAIPVAFVSLELGFLTVFPRSVRVPLSGIHALGALSEMPLRVGEPQIVNAN